MKKQGADGYATYKEIESVKIMKKLTLLLALLTAIFVAWPVHALSAAQESEPIIYFFWGDGCPHSPASTESQHTQTEPAPASTESQPNPTETMPGPTNPLPLDFQPLQPEGMRDNGFALAIVTMIVMAAALIYTLAAFIQGKSFPLPAWADWLVPAVIVFGIGVAGYLSYVETREVAAVCGPVGDCNAVQTSSYATLLGFLPVGVLGLLGYLGLLAAWLTRKYIPRLEKTAAIAFLYMAIFAVVFSLYLTYLELFVIKAVCIWCITSAWLVTILLLLGLPPATRLFSVTEGDAE